MPVATTPLQAHDGHILNNQIELVGYILLVLYHLKPDFKVKNKKIKFFQG